MHKDETKTRTKVKQKEEKARVLVFKKSTQLAFSDIHGALITLSLDFSMRHFLTLVLRRRECARSLAVNNANLESRVGIAK